MFVNIFALVNESKSVVYHFHEQLRISAKEHLLSGINIEVPLRLTLMSPVISECLAFGMISVRTTLLNDPVHEVEPNFALVDLLIVLKCCQFHHFEVVDVEFELCVDHVELGIVLVKNLIALLHSHPCKVGDFLSIFTRLSFYLLQDEIIVDVLTKRFDLLLIEICEWLLRAKQTKRMVLKVVEISGIGDIVCIRAIHFVVLNLLLCTVALWIERV